MSYERTYVSQLSDAEKFVLVEGYEELRATGWLGDHPLRQHGMVLARHYGIGDHNIVMLMEQLANAVYWEFAQRWLKENQV